MIHGIIDDQRKTLSELCKKLQSAGFTNAETLVLQRGNPVTFLMGKIGWNDCEVAVDVCGYPIGFGAELNLL